MTTASRPESTIGIIVLLFSIADTGLKESAPVATEFANQ
jgi:hypothetical protein